MYKKNLAQVLVITQFFPPKGSMNFCSVILLHCHTYDLR